MSSTTSIQWTDATWNPVRGCSRISPGCEHCYAETMASRFTKPGQAFHTFAADGRWTRKVSVITDMLTVPMHWKKPRRIFVNSMSDLFHESLSHGDIAQIFEVMRRCPQHTFQILTKRAERMRDWFGTLSGKQWGLRDGPLPNVWLGVSIEDQARADERIPHLLKVPAVVRFLSVEPLLGEVSLERALGLMLHFTTTFNVPTGTFGETKARWAPSYNVRTGEPIRPGVQWVIVGGESGAGARPFALEWARSIVAQCKAAGVACFVKQLGAAAHLRDSHGGDPAEWPADLRVREFPHA